MTLVEYLQLYGHLITQNSERLFVEDFLYPLLGTKIEHVIPQHQFIDSTGKLRRIDFAYIGSTRLAFEIDGETYHAEGVIPNDSFDDSLFRQNEMLRLGYKLIRFSYNQLQSPMWRSIITDSLRTFISDHAPELLTEYALEPSQLQHRVLDALHYYRELGWKKGVVVLPTGTGKTILSALDAKRHGGRVLFLVHRLDILKQSIDAYRKVWPDLRVGILTGEVRESSTDCDVLFASKDTLRHPDELAGFGEQWFNYIVVDEVHHGQSPTYREVLEYFEPDFMLGMTATPDRTDRRDIFELFDYNKVYELSLTEAIEEGILVPYSYYGLTDDIDYSSIRYENQRYNTGDLERLLIIPERNEAIVREYVEKGEGDKAIGFCVSIRHAERMAEVFIAHGISAVAIHSSSPERDALLAAFRNNEYQVVFTVDLFNEGIDIPNVRVLLFLRPTESKTVFLQQLGRGLRVSTGKDRVRILDFIGNYKRANQIRKYLSKGSHEGEYDENGRRRRRIEYEYSTGCDVHFDPAVEEILNRQDQEELGVTKADLIEAYYALAERLERKPSRTDIDTEGEYKSSVYASMFGSWVKFLREVGEYTEASYHYPQGVHLGHILSILKVFGSGDRTGTHFDDEYIRLRGGLSEGRIGIYQRQVKYKLQAAMELGILTDDRNYPGGVDYTLELTAAGKELYHTLRPVLDRLDLAFRREADGIPSTRMVDTEQTYNAAIRERVASDPQAGDIIYRLFFGMSAVQQMLRFLYHVCRKPVITRQEIYERFFQAPFVKQFCEQEGIDEATLEAARRRCPFLLNILDACGIVTSRTNDIVIQNLVFAPWLMQPHGREEEGMTLRRIESVIAAWPDHAERVADEDISITRELFGPTFLSSNYYLQTFVIVKE